jgi:hypothetical protein
LLRLYWRFIFIGGPRIVITVRALEKRVKWAHPRILHILGSDVFLAT